MDLQSLSIPLHSLAKCRLPRKPRAARGVGDSPATPALGCVLSGECRQAARKPESYISCHFSVLKTKTNKQNVL